MANFAVTHLPFAQADVFSRSFDESIGVSRVPLIEVRRARKSNRVALSNGRIPESIKNDQDQRRVFKFGQPWLDSLKTSYRLQPSSQVDKLRINSVRTDFNKQKRA